MSKTMSRALFALSGAVLVASLAACDGIGSGNRLVSMNIIPGEAATSGTLEAIRKTYTDIPANECVRRQVALIGQFSQSDTSLGTFTERARWSSSNPAVARVSNSGEEPVPGDSTAFFGSGVITPVSPGTTTITATYLDFVSSVTVTVRPIADVRIEPANARLATGSTQIYRLTALQQGVRTDIAASNTLLSFATGSDSNVAVVASSTSNVVAARNPGGPLNLQFDLPTCGRTLTTTVSVADMQSLVLQHEEGFSGDLVVGNIEAFRAFANFGSGPEQDVTANATYSLADSVAAAGRVQLASFSATAVTAGDAVAIRAICCTADRNGDLDATDPGEPAAVTSNDLQITPVAGVLNSITISPLDASIPQLSTQTYTALGSFDGGARTQLVTRRVSWASSDASVATFASNSSIAVSTVETTTPKTATITATPVFTGSTATAVTTNLTVTPPVAP